MSDSVRPHRRQPTRLPCPWDSYTGVGCHFLLQCMKVKVKSLSRVRLLATPWTAAYQAPPSRGFSRQECWNGVPMPSPNTLLVPPKNRRMWAFPAECKLNKEMHGEVFSGKHIVFISTHLRGTWAAPRVPLDSSHFFLLCLLTCKM